MPTSYFYLVRADNGRAGPGETNAGRITADPGAGVQDALPPLDEDRPVTTEHIALVGEARGEGRGPAGATAADDDRRVGTLARFGVAGSVLETEELAFEGGGAVAPEAGADL